MSTMVVAAQIMRQAELVKNSMTESGKPFSELWVQRQKLEDLYKKLLLQDLEYALDKKVEQDLWNHAFKTQISILQTQAKDKENQKKLEAQGSLNLFLETASGFYLQFLQMICSTFKLDLPFRRRSAAFGMTQENIMKNKNIVLPKKSSCLYICCHCLVHLGDIARYRQQMEQAQTFYRHAANLSPNNGQPYNQLAILEASRGDKLSTVFYYVRSLAVRHPFPVAATNLEKFYSKLIKDGRSNFDSASLTVAEIIVAFLQFEALLHMSTDLNRASGLKTKITTSLASHIRSQSLTAAHLTGIVAIAVFAAHQARCDTTCTGDVVKKSAMSEEEERIVQIHSSFIVKLLETLLQHTPKEDNKAKDFLTLSAIKVTFDWLYLNKDMLEGSEFSNTSLWQDLCKLLNTLQWLLNEVNKIPDMTKYVDIPLPEDADLRCFQPLEPSYSVFNFSKLMHEDMSPACERDLRCHRIVAHGRWIAQDLAKLKLVVFQSSKSIRTQFSTKKVVTRPTENAQQLQPKPQRQNVAMQTILKKQLLKKMEQENTSSSVQLSAVSEDNRNQDTKSATDVSKTSPPGLLTATEANTGGRPVGVLPVHHKGNNTFKANLPPRLSAKTKVSAASPRMLKKDDPSSRNRFNSNNSTAANATASFGTSPGNEVDFSSLPTNTEDYPTLTSDNYPALVSQRAALVPADLHHGTSDGGSSNKVEWSPFGAKRDAVQEGSPSASSLLFSETPGGENNNNFGTGAALQYTQLARRVSPNIAVNPNTTTTTASASAAERSGRIKVAEHFTPPSSSSSQSEMENSKARRQVGQHFPMGGNQTNKFRTTATASADPNIALQNTPPSTHQDMSQYRQQLLPNNQQQQQQLSQLLAQQQQQQQQQQNLPHHHHHHQRQILGQPDAPPHVGPYPQQTGMMYDPASRTNKAPVAQQQHQHHQPTTSLLSSLSATSTALSSIGYHPRDSTGGGLAPSAQATATQQGTVPRGMARQPPSVLSGVQSAQTSGGLAGIITSSNMPGGGHASGQSDSSSRISNIGNQLMTNPALIGYIPSPGSMSASNIGKKLAYGNQSSAVSGMPQYSPGGVGRGAGPPPPQYFDSSRMNPVLSYHSHQHYQQQQQQQPQHQHQQQQQPHLQPNHHHQHQQPQQQQQQHGNLDMTSSSGLLYKNIPMAGNVGVAVNKSGMKQSAGGGGGGAGVELGMDGVAASPDFDRHFLSSVPNVIQQAQQGHGLAQLLASQQQQQQGFRSDPGRSPSYHGPASMAAPKPDLMGLHPSPHFLEQHNHPAAKQPQPQSLMNTVIDPPFLQASGEYTLFNSGNNHPTPSWQSPPLVSAEAAAPHHNNSTPTTTRFKPGTMGNNNNKGNRLGPRSGHMDISPNMAGMWTNSGPSPLERLLQQQRNQRQGDS